MDKSVLEAALAEFERQLAGIKAGMKAVTERLAEGNKTRDLAVQSPKPKRRLTAASRKRIAAAQKKRWAEYRKNKAK